MRARRTTLRPLPGDVLPAGRELLSLGERLWPKVAGPWYGTPEHPIGDDDCWPWIARARAGVYRVRGGRRVTVRGASDRLNYGRIRRGGRAEGVIAAHVAAWLVTYGDVPAGLLLRHSCDRGTCCNPRHLVPGTAAQNAADRIARRPATVVA